MEWKDRSINRYTTSQMSKVFSHPQIFSFPLLKVSEQVLDELERKISAKQPTTATHLWQLLQESWAELSSIHLPSLVERMPRISEAVMNEKLKKFFAFFLIQFVFDMVEEDLYLV